MRGDANRRDFDSVTADEAFKGAGTITLAEIIKEHIDSGRRSEAVEMWKAVYTEWQNIRKYPNGRARAKALHREADRFIEDAKKVPEGAKISCREGCAHCCHMEVMITDDEAILLSRRIKEGVDVDVKRLKAQAKIPDLGWKHVPEETRRCVFLGEDNRCRVYEDRPLSCRKYFVQSPPEGCANPFGSSIIFSVNRVEVITSAALNLKPLADTLPRKLLERLK